MDSSIAFHVAKLAQEQGASVILTSFGRTMKITQTIARRLPVTPPVVELDVSNPEHLDTLAERLREHTDRLDGVLHSIGFAPLGAFNVPRSARGRTSARRSTCRSYSLKALAVAALPLMEPGGSIVGLTFDAKLRLAGLRLDGRGQGGVRVDQPLPAPATSGPRASAAISSQPARSGPRPPSPSPASSSLRARSGTSGAPLGWNVTDPVPAATGLRGAAVGLVPGDDRRDRPRRRRRPRHGLLSVPVDRSGELRCTTRLARHGASARR
jgi:enoyl ACP reductase